VLRAFKTEEDRCAVLHALLAADEYGNVSVADEDDNRIRGIAPQGQVSTLAGTGKEGRRDGERTVAQFYGPCGVAVG
jgi:hypothetical protein